MSAPPSARVERHWSVRTPFATSILHTYSAQSRDCEGGGKRAFMRLAYRLSALLLVMASALILQGCATSMGSPYRRQLSHMLPPEHAATSEIAVAFELDQQQPHVAVTAVRDQ